MFCNRTLAHASLYITTCRLPMRANFFFLSLLFLLGGASLDEGLVIWRLEHWQPAARTTGQLTLILPPNTAEVNLSACFTSVVRDATSTLVLIAKINRSCSDEGSAEAPLLLTVNTTLRGPEFYGGHTREAVIYPTRGASHQFILSPSRIEGLGLEYNPTEFWAAKDSQTAKKLEDFRAAHFTPRWVGQPLVQRQATLPVNITFVCLLPPGSGTIWNITSLDAGMAHTLLVGSRLYTLGAGATLQVLVGVQPPFALSTPLAQWVGDMRDSEGVAIYQAPTVLTPPRSVLSQSTLPSCYCGYNVACTLTAESTRHRRVEHLSALHLGALANGAILGAASLPTLPISEAVAIFNDHDANIFRWIMIGFSAAFLFWALWLCLTGPPSTLVPATSDGLAFTSEISNPYSKARYDDDTIPVPRSAAADD